MSLDFASLRGGVCASLWVCASLCEFASWGEGLWVFSPKKEGIVQNKAACITTNIYSTKNY